ncbi:trypsin-like peptidase domain-containing protein [Spirosoma endbachense]|uniref:Serine protease n=1 Tax=Spirosoma endbachense TaxID=2666025 RepID=A0A6P1VXV9_9BACT|nr:trypsin-like peptidase domain-containing protein [Spirosoma endbachense]QHV96660.1 hypothetical protein GJR95_17300 [Spirosoma endbachense]
MKANLELFILLIAFGVVFQSCSNKSPIVAAPDLSVLTLEEVVNSNDQNLTDLLNKVRGSVGRRGPASKTIWSRKNDYGLGLYISANHVYNLSGWSSRSAQLFDLSAENLGIFETSQIPPTSGNIALGDTLIADFPLMHFDISPGTTNTAILPAEDFYLGIIDNQRIKQGPLAQHPGLVQTTVPLRMYDPANRTKVVQTWAAPNAGEKAIAVGYPQDKANYPNGAVAYGKILSDIEATAIIPQLKAAGDVEGDIAYDSNVEFFLEAQALVGMSGGGVFNSAGHLLGIMVRASDQANAPPIIRVVKVSHIHSKMIEFYHRMSESDKRKLLPFIGGEI